MAYRVFNINELVYDASKLANMSNQRLKLIRLGTTGAYDRGADLPAAGAEISIANWTCQSLDIGTGFGWVIPLAIARRKSDDDGIELGSIKFQVYDGTSWYWYKPAVGWTVVSAATDWGTELNTLTYFATYPGRYKRMIGLKILVQPDADGLWAPEILALTVVYNIGRDFDPQEDALRSVKQACDLVQIPSRARVRLAAAGASFTLNPELTPVTAGVWRVYNMTTDPTKITNIFSSWVNPTLTMTSSQPINSVIEVLYEGTAPAFLSADDDGYTSQTPSWVVRKEGPANIARDFSQAGITVPLPNAGLTEMRIEHLAETKEMALIITAQSAKSHEMAENMVNALSEYITLNQVVDSYAGVGKLPLRMVIESDSQAIEIEKGLYVCVAPLRILAKQWNLSRRFELQKVLQKIRFNIGDLTKVFETLEVER